MHKIENTTYHKVSDLNPKEFREFFTNELRLYSKSKIYNQISDLSEIYPNFDDWFFNVVIPDLELKNGVREIIFSLTKIIDNSIPVLSGIAILKKTDHEKKICTIRVHEHFRNFGIGSELFEKCFEFLETRKPVISISENSMDMFRKHIEDFNFELSHQLKGYYVSGITEYVFNGDL